MKSIKSQLITYFICLGLSFIIGWLNIMSQPLAFLVIQIVGILFITLVEAVKMRCNLVETVVSILVVEFIACIGMLPSFLIAWIFHLNCFVVFEVYAFISIFLFNGKKRKHKLIKFN